MKEILIKHWVTVLLIIFLVFIFVFDKNGLIKRWELNRDISELEDQRDYYIQKIEKDSMMLENLKDDVFLEKYARERYLMKNPKETIYIVK